MLGTEVTIAVLVLFGLYLLGIFFFFNSTLYLILMMVVYILQSTGKLRKMLFLNFISLAVHLIVKWHLSNNITTSIPHCWFSLENSTFLRKHHLMSCF